jgi:hypothetical protein
MFFLKTLDLFETLTWDEIKLRLDKRFMSHILVLQDAMEFLELAQGDNKGFLAIYGQDFKQM